MDSLRTTGANHLYQHRATWFHNRNRRSIQATLAAHRATRTAVVRQIHRSNDCNADWFSPLLLFLIELIFGHDYTHKMYSFSGNKNFTDDNSNGSVHFAQSVSCQFDGKYNK